VEKLLEVLNWWFSYFFGLINKAINAFYNAPYVETFSETLIADQSVWEGYCLVQRIEAVRLSHSGKQVKLTLRASSSINASIETVRISRPALAGEPYASATDLTAVSLPRPPSNTYGLPPCVVPANSSVTGSTYYNLDEGQPLLIAVDFSAAPASGIRCTEAVPPEQASAYYKKGSEAMNPDRTGFTAISGIYLIEKIEVS